MKIHNGTSRVRGALAVLPVLTLLAAGCAHQWAAEPYGQGAHITILVVTSDAVIPDPVRLHKKQSQEAEWYSWPGSTLTIQFDDPTLFPGLSCSGNHCSSGPIAREAAYKPNGYHARVNSPERKASLDPTIMIEP